MRTVQMTLDDDLIAEVDKVVSQLNTNRSAFTRDALREALARIREALADERHRQGYIKYPVVAGEFYGPEEEQELDDILGGEPSDEWGDA